MKMVILYCEVYKGLVVNSVLKLLEMGSLGLPDMKQTLRLPIFEISHSNISLVQRSSDMSYR